jgi:hypothetical protein
VIAIHSKADLAKWMEQRLRVLRHERAAKLATARAYEHERIAAKVRGEGERERRYAALAESYRALAKSFDPDIERARAWLEAA